MLPSLYPLLRQQYDLSYSQLGVITLVFHLLACLCQLAVGGFTDLLWVAALVGLGSSIFHPEASRAARAALPLLTGLAQSVFQLGGNVGSASALPLLGVLGCWLPKDARPEAAR